MPVAPPVKVRIRNGEGLYLSGDPSQWSFSADRCRAVVFDYVRHQIGQQLEELRLARGIVLEAEPVEPEEVYEICERCHRFATAFAMHFDGHSFLCLECLAQTNVSILPASMQKARAFTSS